MKRGVPIVEIARAVDAVIERDCAIDVTGVSSLELAGEGDLAYVDSEKHARVALASRACAFVVRRVVPDLERPQLVVPNPRLAFARIALRFFVPVPRRSGITEPVHRGEGVEIGPDVTIGPFVTLGDGARIGARVTLGPGTVVGAGSLVGDDTFLHPNVVVGSGCSLGRRVIVHAGVVIGADGFGYVPDEAGRLQKIPQLGGVEIGDDVEIGANTTIDRATFGKTVVGRGTKIDNLVQVAHNVTIGEHCILVAQMGVAGSTRLGAHVVVGGQAGVTDHVELGDRVMVAARTGVNRSIPAGQVVSGVPALPHEVFVKAQAVIPRLPELRQKVREMERRLRALEAAAARHEDDEH